MCVWSLGSSRVFILLHTSATEQSWNFISPPLPFPRALWGRPESGFDFRKVLALSLHGEGGEARRGEDLEGGGAPPPK